MMLSCSLYAVKTTTCVALARPRPRQLLVGLEKVVSSIHVVDVELHHWKMSDRKRKLDLGDGDARSKVRYNFKSLCVV